MEDSSIDIDAAAKHILIIEDLPQLNRFLAQLLEHLGYSVSTATDGRDGIERYRARPFDLVITDVFMPNKDGLQVIREIIDEFPDARFVAMSGAGSYGDPLLEARRLGAQYTFRKPFNTEDLLQVIQREVGRP
ncbi:MAG: response regulator [Candidatus Latescibacteria bacterium]|jgi:CheY-like chemotaxis protein|nr:response regulator [Candidatus Latescibacterota bacterium]